eukprot:COSAG01_NODE_1544_length_9968_cov_20.144594_7_plen_90_part_00
MAFVLVRDQAIGGHAGAKDHGREVQAIDRSSVLRQGLLREREDGDVDVERRRDGVADGARLDLAWPVDDARLAKPTFPLRAVQQCLGQV